MTHKTFFGTVGIGFRASIILLITSLILIFLRTLAIVQFLLTPGLGLVILAFLFMFELWFIGRILTKSKKFIFG